MLDYNKIANGIDEFLSGYSKQDLIDWVEFNNRRNYLAKIDWEQNEIDYFNPCETQTIYTNDDKKNSTYELAA